MNYVNDALGLGGKPKSELHLGIKGSTLGVQNYRRIGNFSHFSENHISMLEAELEALTEQREELYRVKTTMCKLKTDMDSMAKTWLDPNVMYQSVGYKRAVDNCNDATDTLEDHDKIVAEKRQEIRDAQTEYNRIQAEIEQKKQDAIATAMSKGLSEDSAIAQVEAEAEKWQLEAEEEAKRGKSVRLGLWIGGSAVFIVGTIALFMWLKRRKK